MPSARRPSFARPTAGAPEHARAAVLDVEVIATVPAAGLPDAAEVRRLLALTFASAGIADGHVAVELVDEARIAQLNAEHRGKRGPTDILSFPMDGAGDVAVAGAAGSRELGDIVICPQHTVDLREAIVHGALHLTGMDHEADDGEMLALQAEILSW